MIEILSKLQDYLTLYHILLMIARTDIHKITQKIQFSFVTHEGFFGVIQQCLNETYP